MNPIGKNTLWHSKLDEIYLCKVERFEEGRGFLTIHDHTGTLLHREEVAITNDAKTGLDLFDLSTWQNKSIAFVDNLGR